MLAAGLLQGEGLLQQVRAFRTRNLGEQLELSIQVNNGCPVSGSASQDGLTGNRRAVVL